jgi:hypothetical protein
MRGVQSYPCTFFAKLSTYDYLTPQPLSLGRRREIYLNVDLYIAGVRLFKGIPLAEISAPSKIQQSHPRWQGFYEGIAGNKFPIPSGAKYHLE